jgi:hypothetical protein
MSIFAGDVIIKTMLELAMDDMRKKPWLIEDVFSDFIENPILAAKYGMNEINNAKDFIKNNKINYYMSARMDKEEFPAITISLGPSPEDKQLATLGDQTVDSQDFTPSQIDQPIKYIIPPFKIDSYDKATGIITLPESLEGYQYISAGMIIIDPKTGGGFIINEKVGTSGLQIAAGSKLPAKELAIIPQYQLYRARREGIKSQETYQIGVHVHGDPAFLMYLFPIVKYGILRYREALLEANNFQNSTISCSDLINNDAFQSDKVYSRFITISGVVEETWLKTPQRFIESLALEQNVGTTEMPVIESGIKILSQKAPPEYDTEDDSWTTVDE